MENAALQKFLYGMFVLTAREGDRDNGCIVNTVMQVSSHPNRIAVCMFKGNLTHEMVASTGRFNLCALTPAADPGLFLRFGSRSGRKAADKFEGLTCLERSENGLYFLTEGANSVLSAKVTQTVDLDDHTLFLAEVTGANVLSDQPTCSFEQFKQIMAK